MCDFFFERVGIDGTEQTVANYAIKKDSKQKDSVISL